MAENLELKDVLLPEHMLVNADLHDGDELLPCIARLAMGPASSQQSPPHASYLR